MFKNTILIVTLCTSVFAQSYSIKASVGTSTRSAETGSANEGFQELRETTNNGQVLSIAGTYYFKDAIGAGLYFNHWYDIGGEAEVNQGDERSFGDMTETINFMGAYGTYRTGTQESFTRFFGVAGLGLASLKSETILKPRSGNFINQDVITNGEGSTFGLLMGLGTQLSIYKGISGIIEAEYMHANIGELELSTKIGGFGTSTVEDYSLSYWAVKIGLKYEL